VDEALRSQSCLSREELEALAPEVSRLVPCEVRG